MSIRLSYCIAYTGVLLEIDLETTPCKGVDPKDRLNSEAQRSQIQYPCLKGGNSIWPTPTPMTSTKGTVAAVLSLQ